MSDIAASYERADAFLFGRRTYDLLASIADLKASGDGELYVPGSSRLVQWPLEKDLVDEMELMTVPVILGQGDRLFAAASPRVQLELLNSSIDSKGVVIETFRPAGH